MTAHRTLGSAAVGDVRGAASVPSALPAAPSRSQWLNDCLNLASLEGDDGPARCSLALLLARLRRRLASGLTGLAELLFAMELLPLGASLALVGV